MKQTLKYILQYVLENQKLAETKHSIIIALNGAIVALILGYLKNANTVIKSLNWAVIFFCGLSIIISFFALHSRAVKVRTKVKKLEDINLLYYSNLAQMSSGELISNIIKYYDFPNTYLPDNFDKDLASTIVATSIVVSIKYKLFNKSTFFCVIGIVCALVMFAMVGVNLW